LYSNLFHVIFFPMEEPHRKMHPSQRAARRERTLLQLVRGDGVVPLLDPHDDRDAHQVVTVRGRNSLADLLAEVGTLPEAAARGTGNRIAGTLARLHRDGVVHGDIKPANVVFAPDGDLWLVDFDAAGPHGGVRHRATPGRLPHPTPRSLHPRDDVLGIAIMVVECATGVVLDPTTTWSDCDLRRIGCSSEFAADMGPVLRDPPSAAQLGGLLARHDDRLPAPPRSRTANDPTPTVDIPSVALAGLVARGASTTDEPGPVPYGWRRSARAGRD
jgi:serine/threonine protein kinase